MTAIGDARVTDLRLTRRWLGAVGAGAALGLATFLGAGAIGSIVWEPEESLPAIVAAAVAGPVTALALAWWWLPVGRRSGATVGGLAALLLVGFGGVALAMTLHSADPGIAPRVLSLLAFPVGLLSAAPLRDSARALARPATSGSAAVAEPDSRRAPRRPAGEPVQAPASRRPRPDPGVTPPARLVEPVTTVLPRGSERDPDDRVPESANARPAQPARSETTVPPGRPAPAIDVPTGAGTDTRIIAAARQVEAVIENAARRVAPILERRLVAYYGDDWLRAVNLRRRRGGHPAGRRLRDYRFCLAILGHDPATEGWASSQCRRAALDLNRLGSKAVHRATMTVVDLERAKRMAQRLLDSLPED
ncbi:MAG TPA: hypothetical protein VGD43_04290 [Micromonospora sp.]